MKNRLLCAVIASGFGACSNLPNLAPGECGNGVVDGNEECDTFTNSEYGEGTSCSAECQYVCRSAQEEFECPIGWGCGADGTCRHGVSDFQETLGSPYLLPNQIIAIDDIDGDANPDLVGLSTTEVSIRYGSGEGQFVAELDFPLDRGLGLPRLAPLDAESGAELLAPLANGVLVARGTTDRTLVPVITPSFDLGDIPATALRITTLEMQTPWSGSMLLIGVPETADDPAQIVAGIVSFGRFGKPGVPDVDNEENVLSDGRLLDVVGDIPRANVLPNTVGGGGEHVAHEFALPIRNSRQLDVFQLQFVEVFNNETMRNENEATIVKVQSIPLSGTLQRGARFADANNDGRLDILMSVRPDGVEQNVVMVALNNGNQALNDSFAVPFVETAFDTLALSGDASEFAMEVSNPGRQKWPLASTDVNGDGLLDHVSTDGVFINVGNAANPVFLPSALRGSPDPWISAVAADFHGDDAIDVVAISEATDGVDFLIGTGTGLFNRSRVDTTKTPFALRVGDFDGDLVNDLLLAERDALDIEAGDSLSVMFGRSSASLLPPVEMGRFDFVLGLETQMLLDGLSSVDLTTDVLVQSNSQLNGLGSTSLANLFGSAQRRLLAPFLLSEIREEPLEDVLDAPIAVIDGLFDSASNGFRDVLAFSFERVWRLPGQGNGLFDFENTSNWELDSLFDVSSVRLECVLWHTLDLNSDGVDELLGIDNAPIRGCGSTGGSIASNMIVVGSTDGEAPQIEVKTLSDQYRLPNRIESADLNGDGFPEVLIVFSGVRGTATNIGERREGAAAIVYWNQDGVLDFTDPSFLQNPDGTGDVQDVLPVHANEDAMLEVLLLTPIGVFLASSDPDGAFETESTPRIETLGGTRLAAGDANRDGVTDVFVSDNSLVSAFLGVDLAANDGGNQ